MKLKETLILSLIFLFSASCANSNLHQRPIWAKNTTLPALEVKKYPESRYLVQIVDGTGRTLKEAMKQAEYEANTAFARLIATRITSVYQKRTRTLSTQNQKSIRKNIDSYLNLATKDVLLSGLKRIASWDGYEENTKHFFACYVLDKDKAGNVIQQNAEEKFQLIQESQRRLSSNPSRTEKERLAFEALKNIMEFELLQQQALFFERQLPIFKNGQALKQESLRIIHKGIEQRMLSPLTREREEALAFAEKSLAYYPSGVIQGKINELRLNLPCLECKGGKNCIHCKGVGGFFQNCPTCNGNKKAYYKCLFCKGDGKQTCPTCNGTRYIGVPCRYCKQKGRVTCPTCKGKGSFVGKCKHCNGAGNLMCGNCRGTGRRRNARGQWVVCDVCKGAKQLRCNFCRGNGRLTYKCQASAASYFSGLLGGGNSRYKFCDGIGTVLCPQCKGTLQVRTFCHTCQGTGRTGVCPQCRGAGQILQDCKTCPIRHKGKIFVGCRHCGGTGRCPVCKGSGHR